MEYKLKVCPFCGGEPFIKSYHRTIGGLTAKVAFVRCSVCNVRTERYFGHTSHSAQAVKRAVESWNRRV